MVHGSCGLLVKKKEVLKIKMTAEESPKRKCLILTHLNKKGCTFS